ncbi:hypothetical protein KGQ31_02005 [Patescibacteria group bacterium]|nr:hypothetical protein [Patescibacteria group bacterium]
MANLGSEVAGMYSAIEQSDPEKLHSCHSRAKKIVNEFRRLEQRPAALAEMAKLEEIIDDLAAPERKLDVPKADLESYFLPFALRLMSR